MNYEVVLVILQHDHEATPPHGWLSDLCCSHEAPVRWSGGNQFLATFPEVIFPQAIHALKETVRNGSGNGSIGNSPWLLGQVIGCLATPMTISTARIEASRPWPQW